MDVFYHSYLLLNEAENESCEEFLMEVLLGACQEVCVIMARVIHQSISSLPVCCQTKDQPLKVSRSVHFLSWIDRQAVQTTVKDTVSGEGVPGWEAPLLLGRG